MTPLVAIAVSMFLLGGIVGACIMRRYIIRNADSTMFMQCDGNYYKVFRLDMTRGGVAGDPGEYLKVDR